MVRTDDRRDDGQANSLTSLVFQLALKRGYQARRTYGYSGEREGIARNMSRAPEVRISSQSGDEKNRVGEIWELAEGGC